MEMHTDFEWLLSFEHARRNAEVTYAKNPLLRRFEIVSIGFLVFIYSLYQQMETVKVKPLKEDGARASIEVRIIRNWRP
ncbi:hypothetical protein SSX86_001783 [Deinandra increscens subsp. villosa]|uniref:Uncharacterized protein n=1 Tax=Deinandra increscens subsp. villosa TaxID=3103831 RepID=A0AAP0DZS5_9ASTR